MVFLCVRSGGHGRFVYSCSNERKKRVYNLKVCTYLRNELKINSFASVHTRHRIIVVVYRFSSIKRSQVTYDTRRVSHMRMHDIILCS